MGLWVHFNILGSIPNCVNLSASHTGSVGKSIFSATPKKSSVANRIFPPTSALDKSVYEDRSGSGADCSVVANAESVCCPT